MFSNFKHNNHVGEGSNSSRPSSKLISSFQEYIPLIASIIITISLVFYYLTVIQSPILTQLSYFRIRWFVLLSMGVNLVITILASFYNPKIQSTIRSYSALIHSFLISLVSYGYIIRNYDTSLSLFEFQYSTSIIVVPITVLVFLLNYKIFTASPHSSLLSAFQALLVIVFAFSFVNFIIEDGSFARNFGEGWLAVIFKLPRIALLAMCAQILAFVTSRNITFANTERKIIYLMSYYILCTQIMVSLYLLDIAYWYKSLLALISWNFIYTSIIGLAKGVNDVNYNSRFIVSIIYHIFLYILVIYVA